jgi:hypothetical protein
MILERKGINERQDLKKILDAFEVISKKKGEKRREE